MHLKLKKSRISNWWVAEEREKMAFFNILSGKNITAKLKVVGYLDGDEETFATSTNYVVRVTKDGVITLQGTFYPFEEAHELYLQFLIKANTENPILAFRWKELEDGESLIANIVRDGKVEKDVIFDFEQDEGLNVVFSGFSRSLDSKVLVSTFNRKENCLILHGVNDEMRRDIKITSVALEEESKARIEVVQRILKEVAKGVCCVISVRA